MDYKEVLSQARTHIGTKCKACEICNGVACRNRMPGPGAKGVGDTAIRNYDKWIDIRVNLDTICERTAIDPSFELFGKTFRYPFFAAPIGAINLHYGEKYNDITYTALMIDACAQAGITAFTGDGPDPRVLQSAAESIGKAGGVGIPTVKPWDMKTLLEKLEMVRKAGVFAVAMDVDAAGLPFLKSMNLPAGRMPVQDLGEVIKAAGLPFIVKGIMTAKGAIKARDAGAAAIVVSNHGGRVLDQCPATAEVLPEIAKAVGGSLKILVDGGIRSGVEVFKALALGADGVLIGRPFVPMAFGGGDEAVRDYVAKIGGELEDTMMMCGAFTLDQIDRSMVRLPG